MADQSEFMGDDVEELLHYNLIIKLFQHFPNPTSTQKKGTTILPSLFQSVRIVSQINSNLD